MSTIYLAVAVSNIGCGVALFKSGARKPAYEGGSMVLGLGQGELHHSGFVRGRGPDTDALAFCVATAKAVRRWGRAKACTVGGACAPEFLIFERTHDFISFGLTTAIAARFGFAREDHASIRRVSLPDREVLARLSESERVQIERDADVGGALLQVHAIGMGLRYLERMPKGVG